MQKLRIVCIAVLLSFILAIIARQVHIAETTESEPTPLIEMSYHELHRNDRKQIDCLADNIYFEARSEPKEGQKAIAFVTMNRVSDKSFGSTVCGVVKQASNSVCQFSWWCDTKTRAQSEQRRVDKRLYDQARKIALEVYFNYDRIQDNTRGALFYHAIYVPYSKLGVKDLQPTVKIGRHIFYRT